MKWLDCNVGHFVEKGLATIQTGPFGTQLKASDYVDEGTPVINVRNIGFGGLKQDRLEYVGEQTTDRLSQHLLARNDLVFGRKGAVDRHLLVKEDQDGWMQGSDCIRLRFETDEVFAPFVSYQFLKTEHQQWMLTQAGNKATMASLNQDIIKRIPLRLPPKSVQMRVSDLLSAYDNLIENNLRRIALLEEAARLLYQEWFVRLRFPGHEHARIIDGLPEGWERKPSSEAMAVQSGGTPKTTVEDYWDGEIPFYTPKDAQDRWYVTDTEKHLTEMGLQRCNSRLYPKDTLFVTARGTVGNLNLAQRPMAMNQSCYALSAMPPLTQRFLLLEMKEAVDHFRQQAVGAVFDAVVVDTFKLIPFVVPTANLVALFDEAVQPVFAQVENLLLQNQKLRAARDLLLPRLMSGEISA